MRRLDTLVKRGLRRLRRPRPAPVVLMYHRIAEPEVDPWGLAVSPSRFEDQLMVLRQTRTVLSLQEFGRRLADRRLPDNAAAITFDDGYACSAVTALPLLQRHSMPATVFVTTGKVGDTTEFWSDALERIAMESAQPSLAADVSGERIVVELGEVDPEPVRRRWRVASGGPETQRQRAYLHLWRALRNAPSGERDTALAALHVQAGVSTEARSSHRAMSLAEVQDLAREPLIEIGGHSLTHPAMSRISRTDQRSEILGSFAACAELTGAAPASFAYPYGDYDVDSLRYVREAGFHIACTTKGGCVRANADMLQIPRVPVEDVDGDAFSRRLPTFPS